MAAKKQCGSTGTPDDSEVSLPIIIFLKEGQHQKEEVGLFEKEKGFFGRR